ncbi:hypothetical protein [Chelativorans sp. YIM 93263]|uniref:hypothetical protein n=1 Tax=Chelativorans sp. YIM 93263 TaxID=2906648 RepID=UPI002377DDCB|nr:hypothetical protein [Chelativorans sp. YIM 93263]
MEDILYFASFMLAVALGVCILWEFFFGSRDRPTDLHENLAYEGDDQDGDADD